LKGRKKNVEDNRLKMVSKYNFPSIENGHICDGFHPVKAWCHRKDEKKNDLDNRLKIKIKK
jgi:hypothetical protein